MVKWVGEIRDPVHGYIYMSELEKRVVDSKPFQRLHRIKQLAGAELTYPGATHTRFLHSLGVMHVSGIMATRFRDLGYISDDDVRMVRLAGLLHDVGHGPFSHIYEEVLDKRRNLTHEDVTRWLVKESEISDIVEEYGFSRSEIADLSVGVFKGENASILNSIIAGPISSDVMDYLLRDSYFAGVEYGKIDFQRLINCMNYVNGVLALEYPGALSALESYIMSRIQMFNAVYFHRAVRAANVVLGRGMEYADEELNLTGFKSVDDFLRLDDETTLVGILSLKPDSVARRLIEMFVWRHLPKCTYELTAHRRDDFISNLLNRESIRRSIEAEIGEEAGVEPEFVFVDVPSVPSVPMRPEDKGVSALSFFVKKPSGVEIHTISDVPSLISHLAKYIDIIRVYAPEEHREKVEEVCEKIFGSKPAFGRVSM